MEVIDYQGALVSEMSKNSVIEKHRSPVDPNV